MLVIKRNGDKKLLQLRKIRLAIQKANKEVKPKEQATGSQIDEICNGIMDFKVKEIHVETIQDYIEEKLMSFGLYTLARKYVIYRYSRMLERHANTTDNSILSLVRGSNRDVAEENSNKNARAASTQRDLIAGEVSKDLTWRMLLPEDIVEAHKKGVLHFHDADYFLQSIINCCLVNIKDMLDNGTVINGKLIESPKSFQVACTVMTQIVASLASNQYGGQSIAIKHLGKYLKVSEDKIRIKTIERWKKGGISYTEEQLESDVHYQLLEELKNGVQTIQYQVQTLMSVNGQSPFLTLFLELDEKDPYLEYTALIVEEIINQRIQGVKNKNGVYSTPTFPKLVYVLDENNCLKGGKFDYITKLCAKCNVKRIYPDYISAKKMRELHNGEVYSCMGCRSFLSEWRITEEYAKEFNLPLSDVGKCKWEGRFNMGVVSLNLPQIGLVANGDMDLFWEELERRLALCFKALMCRYKALKGTLSDVSEIHWQNGALARLKNGQTIDKLLENGYATISLGYIGIYEMTEAMLGVSHTTPEGKAFALKVLKRLKDATEDWKSETGLGFGLYGTPAESLCYRFCEIDKAKFGNIKDITDKGWYTNSYHVSVQEKIDAFSKLAFEAEFQEISTGGCISYVELPNLKNNIEAVEELIKFLYDTIMYAEFNGKSDYCLECGYDGEIQTVKDEKGDLVWECPNCHNRNQKRMIVTRRTCGYLGSEYWNVGKTKEIAARELHL